MLDILMDCLPYRHDGQPRDGPDPGVQRVGLCGVCGDAGGLRCYRTLLRRAGQAEEGQQLH